MNPKKKNVNVNVNLWKLYRTDGRRDSRTDGQANETTGQTNGQTNGRKPLSRFHRDSLFNIFSLVANLGRFITKVIQVSKLDPKSILAC